MGGQPPGLAASQRHPPQITFGNKHHGSVVQSRLTGMAGLRQGGGADQQQDRSKRPQNSAHGIAIQVIFGKAVSVSKKQLAAVTAGGKGSAWLVFVRAWQGLSASLCGIVVVRQNKQVGFMNRLNRVLAAAVILAVFAAGGIPAASSSIEDGHVPAERVQKKWYGDTVRALAADEDAVSLFVVALISHLNTSPG